MGDLYFTLTIICFFVVILSLIFVVLFNRQIYLLGILFLIPMLFFGYKYLPYSPSFDYFKEEELCGVYEYEDYVISSKPPYPKEYFIRFNQYGIFGFRNNAYPNRVRLDNLKEGQKVCLVLKRRKDKENDLSQAVLILLKWIMRVVINIKPLS